jgi:hypothetical protein
VGSKARRFIEGLNLVGDILTKISANCVINLLAALLFTCLFLWVYLMHGYDCLYIYGYFLYMPHVYVYCNFSVNPCIYEMYFFVYILYVKISQEFCVHMF